MLYDGPPLAAGPISLTAPRSRKMPAILRLADLPENQKGWLERARAESDCLYFSVEHGDETIGQIILHDIDRGQRESLVGFHIFHVAQRGLGYGSAALGAVCRYAFDELELRRLFMITALDNLASRRIAEKCGFRTIGPAREGPQLIAYERLAQA